jgi:hypothetical protein
VNAPIDENIGYQQWQPPAQPQPSGFRYLWNHPVVIAGVMGLLLLMVTTISIIAIKAVGSADDDRDTGQPDRVNPTQQATTQQANPAATGTGAPAVNQPTGTQPAGTAPAVNTTGAVFLSGKLDIRAYDPGVDLDTAKKDSLANTEKFDLDPTETALNAVNRAQVGVGATAASPAGCTATSVKWGASAHVSVLADGAIICAKTSDDRLGAITVTKLDKDSDGQLSSVEVEYVVWKKQGDL